MKSLSIATAIATSLTFGCNNPVEHDTVDVPRAIINTVATNKPDDASPNSSERLQGKVVETMNASGYTYVAVAGTSEKNIWAAGPLTVIKVGDFIDVPRGMEMKDFESKSLGRTFNTIYFVPALLDQSKDRIPSRTSTKTNAHKTPRVEKTASTPNRPSGRVTPSLGSAEMNAGTYTISDLFKQSSSLVGKQVMVRGKVVKFSAAILGTNWLHLQDGSGTAALKNNDLTVTSNGAASVGDVIEVRGVLAQDKDLGAGYMYPVIVERAVLKKASKSSL